MKIIKARINLWGCFCPRIPHILTCVKLNCKKRSFKSFLKRFFFCCTFWNYVQYMLSFFFLSLFLSFALSLSLSLAKICPKTCFVWIRFRIRNQNCSFFTLISFSISVILWTFFCKFNIKNAFSWQTFLFFQRSHSNFFPSKSINDHQLSGIHFFHLRIWLLLYYGKSTFKDYRDVSEQCTVNFIISFALYSFCW